MSAGIFDDSHTTRLFRKASRWSLHRRGFLLLFSPRLLLRFPSFLFPQFTSLFHPAQVPRSVNHPRPSCSISGISSRVNLVISGLACALHTVDHGETGKTRPWLARYDPPPD
jgi:hypothetical protein